MAADRSLIDVAKKEGRVNRYTTPIVDRFARPAAEAFGKKYGIHVDYVRADPIDIVLRLSNEGKAGISRRMSSTEPRPRRASRRRGQCSNGYRIPPRSAGTICRPRAWLGVGDFVIGSAQSEKNVRPDEGKHDIFQRSAGLRHARTPIDNLRPRFRLARNARAGQSEAGIGGYLGNVG
jgi:hypothetical protein